MTKRRSLSDVVNQELTDPTPAAEPEATTAEQSEAEPEPTAKQPTAKKSKPKPQAKTTPHYLTLVRKETRLKEEQFDELSKLSRQLNRQRKSTGGKRSHAEGNRITENTLIRVAIDLLLSQSDKLEGITEEELRESLLFTP
ncbi:hypothetical protein [Oscillatoria acuminata]|uniref:Uncharacterized protein n=1 Tax=Oscillatoria acuminata PCC 6304 TaxID=56110 RepID=K9TSV7_9CYAN|nr:hypothetical protein [Oscillatoria acuminata]AFY85493.1 hypothetical protein Oscil6304_6034 [Oscillatoria acuminata PCC 6304]